MGGLTSDHNDSVGVGAEAAALVVSRVREVGPLDREAHEDVADRAIAGPRRGGEGVLLLQLVALALGHGHAVLEPQRHMAHGHLARDGEAAPLPNHRRGNRRLSSRHGGRRFASCWGKEGALAAHCRRAAKPATSWRVGATCHLSVCRGVLHFVESCWLGVPNSTTATSARNKVSKCSARYNIDAPKEAW